MGAWTNALQLECIGIRYNYNDHDLRLCCYVMYSHLTVTRLAPISARVEEGGEFDLPLERK